MPRVLICGFGPTDADCPASLGASASAGSDTRNPRRSTGEGPPEWSTWCAVIARHTLPSRTMRSTIVLLTVILALAPAAQPRAQAPALSAAFADVDRLFADFAERSHVPGAAWGIIVDGRLAHTGAAGFRDIATKDAPNADTVFRIASMTKSFTAMSILELRDEGKLSLDDPAEQYVPAVASL